MQKAHQGVRVGCHGFAQVVVSLHQQQTRIAGCCQQTVSIIHRNGAVPQTMHQEDWTAHGRQRSQWSNLVKSDADDPLHMPHHIPAKQSIWDLLISHEAAHHLGGMGKRRQADHSADVMVTCGMQQRCSRSNRVAQQRYAVSGDVGLVLEPCETSGNVFGEARHRCERLIVAVPMAPGVQQQHSKSGGVQRWHHGSHHGGVRAPAVHNQHCRCRRCYSLRW